MKIGILCAGDIEAAPFLPLLKNHTAAKKSMLESKAFLLLSFFPAYVRSMPQSRHNTDRYLSMRHAHKRWHSRRPRWKAGNIRYSHCRRSRLSRCRWGYSNGFPSLASLRLFQMRQESSVMHEKGGTANRL